MAKTAVTATNIVIRSATTTSAFINQGETTVPLGASSAGNQKLDKRFIFSGETARPEVLSQTSIKVLNYLINQLKVNALVITSTGRKPHDQARIMFENLETGQSSTYSDAGEKVIKVYKKMKKEGASATEIKEAMTTKIIELGPVKVSKHLVDPQITNAIDFGINSLNNTIGSKKKKEFKKLLESLEDKKNGPINKFLNPENNSGERAFHIEISNKDVKLPGQQKSLFSQQSFPWNNFSIRPKNWIMAR